MPWKEMSVMSPRREFVQLARAEGINNGSITDIEICPRGHVERGAPRYAGLLRVGDEAHLDGNISEL